MSRQPGYRQVSLTAEAHRALQQMTYVISAEIADKVTLSQAVLIGQKLLSGNSARIAVAAREIGIEPNADAQNPAYDAPLCTPGRRIDHEHSVACGPMAVECATPACPIHGASTSDIRYGPTGHPIDPVVCVNALGGDCGPSDCVLDHAPPVVTYSTVRDILRDVQAEVDAFAVGTGTQTLPYVEVIRMIRRVAVARGTAL